MEHLWTAVAACYQNLFVNAIFLCLPIILCLLIQNLGGKEIYIFDCYHPSERLYIHCERTVSMHYLIEMCKTRCLTFYHVILYEKSLKWLFMFIICTLTKSCKTADNWLEENATLLIRIFFQWQKCVVVI